MCTACINIHNSWKNMKNFLNSGPFWYAWVESNALQLMRLLFSAYNWWTHCFKGFENIAILSSLPLCPSSNICLYPDLQDALYSHLEIWRSIWPMVYNFLPANYILVLISLQSFSLFVSNFILYTIIYPLLT